MEDTLFYLFHCILQVEIKCNPIYTVVVYLLCENMLIFIFIVFHWTCVQYDFKLRLVISMLWGCTLFHSFQSIL